MKESIYTLILKIITATAVIVFIIGFFGSALYLRQKLYANYNISIILYEEGNYQEAYDRFMDDIAYLNSYTWALVSNHKLRYNQAIKDIENKNYEEAREILRELRESKYRDPENDEYVDNLIIETDYLYAIQLHNQEKFEDALVLFAELEEYKESQHYYIESIKGIINKSKEIIYKNATLNYNNQDYKKALQDFEFLGNYKNSQEMVNKCKDILKEN